MLPVCTMPDELCLEMAQRHGDSAIQVCIFAYGQTGAGKTCAADSFKRFPSRSVQRCTAGTRWPATNAWVSLASRMEFCSVA